MRTATSIALLLASMAGAAADDHRESAFRGKRLAEANCATCHAVAQVDASPLAQAPPLREIGGRIPFELLLELLRGQVFVEHAVMPDFEPDTRQAEDLATYLASIASSR